MLCYVGDAKAAAELYSMAMRACQRDETGASCREHMALLLSNRAAAYCMLGKHLEVSSKHLCLRPQRRDSTCSA